MAMTAWVGEIRQQLDLLIGEGAHFLTVNLDDADQAPFFQHRSSEHAARAGKLSKRRLHRIIHVARDRLHVGYLNHLLGSQHTAKAGVSGGPNKWRTPSGFGVFGRCAVQGHGAEKHLLRGAASMPNFAPHRLVWHLPARIEHGREFTWRT